MTSNGVVAVRCSLTHAATSATSAGEGFLGRAAPDLRQDTVPGDRSVHRARRGPQADDPDRYPRLLHGRGSEDEVLDGVVGAGVAERLAGPRALQNVECLVQATVIDSRATFHGLRRASGKIIAPRRIVVVRTAIAPSIVHGSNASISPMLMPSHVKNLSHVKYPSQPDRSASPAISKIWSVLPQLPTSPNFMLPTVGG